MWPLSFLKWYQIFQWEPKSSVTSCQTWCRCLWASATSGGSCARRPRSLKEKGNPRAPSWATVFTKRGDSTFSGGDLKTCMCAHFVVPIILYQGNESWMVTLEIKLPYITSSQPAQWLWSPSLTHGKVRSHLKDWENILSWKKKPLSRFDLLCSIWNFRCSLIKKIPANKKWVLEIFGWEASNKNILFHIKYHSLKWDQRGEKLAGYRGQKKTRHSGYFQHLTFNLCMRQGWELLWDLSAQLGVTDEISVWS